MESPLVATGTIPVTQLRDALGHVAADHCTGCVGRLFAHALPAASNAQRGRALRPEAPDPSAACPLCEGLPTRFDALAELCTAASAGVEFASFLVGCVLFDEVRARERALHDRLADAVPALRRDPAPEGAAAPTFAPAEFLKAEVNREVGKRLEARVGHPVDFRHPELTFEVDTRFDHVRLRLASVFVRGRYRKLERTLPQTRWPCRACSGVGCRRCAGSGRTYPTSVEELVAAPFVEAAAAPGEAFHGMGREDIDARMLGSGRPFVLELKQPRRRTLDWAQLATEAGRRSGGRVEVLSAGPATAETVRAYKAADPQKSYRARCAAAAPLDVGNLIRLLPSFGGVLLDQRTPERVAHRRADLVRKRRVLDVRLLDHAGNRFELEIRAESGTYIKEFVSGDGGRTRPSLSEALGVPCRVEELDVVDVHWVE